MNSNKNSRVFKRTAAGALVCSLCAAMLFSAGASALNASAAGRLDDPVLGNYFVSDYNSMSDVNNAVAEYGKQVMEEGVVMLKNDAISQTENALPLRPRSEDGKLYVSMFGKTSVEYDMMNSTVFQNYGITLNPQLLSFYNNNERSGEGRGSYVNYNTELAGKPTGETPWSMYENDTGNVIQSFDDYSDAAVVCLRRYVGEGHDGRRPCITARMQTASFTKLPGAGSMPISSCRKPSARTRITLSWIKTNATFLRTSAKISITSYSCL